MLLDNIMENFVSILTPTNSDKRFEFIKLLAEYSIRTQKYPKKFIEWIIVDCAKDRMSDDNINKLMELSGVNTHYYHHPDGNGRIGYMRNKTNEYANFDKRVCMDDDDYYFDHRVKECSDKLNKYHLVGRSELDIYDFDLNVMVNVGQIHKNHSCNGSIAHTKYYWDMNKYDDQVSKAEESIFTNNFRNKMRQLKKPTMICFSHFENTHNKRYIVACGLSNCDGVKQSKKKIHDIVPEKVIKRYTDICLPYDRHSLYSDYDIVIYCGHKHTRNKLKIIKCDDSNIAVYGPFIDESVIKGIKYIPYNDFKGSIKYKNLYIYGNDGIRLHEKADLHADNVEIY